MTGSNPGPIVVRDGEDLISIDFADVEKYHVQGSIGGAALGFRVMQAGFAALYPDSPPRREAISIVTGHPGPGFRDAIELVTRAVPTILLRARSFKMLSSTGWAGKKPR